MERLILHSDINNCYAAIESISRPELKTVPMAVGGSSSDRHGIILAKNELAKLYKIKTGEAIWEAKKKCPGLLIIQPNYDLYVEVCEQVRSIYRRYTDQVENFGMDECWLDCTGSQRLFGDGLTIARRIAKEIREEIGLTVSIGVANNKVFAKLASDLRKPDAITLAMPESYETKIFPLPVGELLGVGPATNRKLNKIGIFTIGQLARLDLQVLHQLLGKNGVMLGKYARGEGYTVVQGFGHDEKILSIGRGLTTREDMVSEAAVYSLMKELAQEVGARLRGEYLLATAVSISVRDTELFTKEYQTSLGYETHSGSLIAQAGLELFRERYRWERPVRSLTIRALRLVDWSEGRQLSYCSPPGLDKTEQLDLSVEGIRKRFGRNAIFYGNKMKHEFLFSKTDVRVLMPTGWHSG